MYFKAATKRRISTYPLSKFVYAFDCTIFMTAKALHRMTMNGFLVGATKPKKTHTKTRPTEVSRGNNYKLLIFVLLINQRSYMRQDENNII